MPAVRGKRSSKRSRKSPSGESVIIPVDSPSTNIGSLPDLQNPSRLSFDGCIDPPSSANSLASRPSERRRRGSRVRRQSQRGRSIGIPVDPLPTVDPLMQCNDILIDPPSSRGSLINRQSSRGRGRQRNRPSRNQSRQADVINSLSTSQPPQRRGRQRNRPSRNQSRQANVIDLLSTSQPPQTRPRRNSTRQARPTVISLDVTYSSDELEVEEEKEEIPSLDHATDNILNFSLSPCSDVAEISDSKICSSTPPPSPPPPSPPPPPLSPINVEGKEEDTEENKDLPSNYSSDYEEEEDILFVDYSAKRDEALKKAFKEIKAMEKEERKEKVKTSDAPFDCITVLDDDNSPKKKSKHLNLSFLDSPIYEPKVKKAKTKKMVKALESLKQFSEELSKMKADGSFNGDVTVVSDEEEDSENTTITLFIKFESDYMRCKVRQFQKFSSVYEDIAKRLSLNAAQILLCHDDKVISQEKCPADLKLSYGDVIECGVRSQSQSQSTLQIKETITKQSPGTIPLKVQNSDRKGTVTIYIEQSGKMKELMYRYAEEKNIPLEELQFSFDGEILNPNDTPKSLDLEGGECIDVYRK